MASNLVTTALLPLGCLMLLLVRVASLPPQAVEEMKSHLMRGPYYAADSANSSQQCRDHLQRFLLDEAAKIFPAIDATGKPGSGILGGNLAWLGSFELCRNITDMQYCLIDMIVDAQIPGSSNVSMALPIRWGLCTVNGCDEADLAFASELILQDVLGIDWINVHESTVHCARDPPKPYNAGFYILISICIILGALMIAGWCLDVAIRYNVFNESHADKPRYKFAGYSYDESKEDTPLLKGTPDVAAVSKTKRSHVQDNGLFVDFLLCFALNKNLNGLLSTHQSEKAITCLHGLRVISMAWILLGHTFLWPVTTMVVDNITTLLDWLKLFSFQAVVNGTFSVDTFFFLSGLLVGYLIFFEMDKRDGKFPWFQFYFHRYWRLTPLLLFTILFWMYVKPWLGQGPVWYMMTDQSVCEKYWWTNLLYINNFYPTDSLSGCIPWTWYLANDMQFHWISPIIILIAYMSAKAGLVVLSILLTACLATTAVLFGYFEFPASPTDAQFNAAADVTQGNYMDVVYIKPYCRITPFLTGIALGFLLQRKRRFEIRHKYVVCVVGWIVAVGTAIAVVYGLYKPDGANKMSTAENIIYGTLCRFAWSISLAWVVFACVNKMAGPVNTILSWSFWIPLSRLTYVAYMFHPMVLDVLVFNFATPFHYTLNIIAYLFVGVTFMTYALGALIYLAVEVPMTNLEKLVRRRIGKTKKEK